MALPRLARLEKWIIDTASRVAEGRYVEDSRVELKREWPLPKKAARQIAGHANASFGSEILWVIGVDEKAGIVGCTHNELANWWPAVCACFEGVSPSLTDLSLDIDGKAVVGLILSTDRPPYVVKNPSYGKDGGAIAYEVPWREGTSVKTATRNNLLRILTLPAVLPELEVLGGHGEFYEVKPSSVNRKHYFCINFNIDAYLVPNNESALVIPFHRCTCRVLNPKTRESIEDCSITIHCPTRFGAEGPRSDSVTMERTTSELIAHGPGNCEIRTEFVLDQALEWVMNDLTVEICIATTSSELPVKLLLTAKTTVTQKDILHSWSVENG